MNSEMKGLYYVQDVHNICTGGYRIFFTTAWVQNLFFGNPISPFSPDKFSDFLLHFFNYISRFSLENGISK